MSTRCVRFSGVWVYVFFNDFGCNFVAHYRCFLLTHGLLSVVTVFPWVSIYCIHRFPRGQSKSLLWGGFVSLLLSLLSGHWMSLASSVTCVQYMIFAVTTTFHTKIVALVQSVIIGFCFVLQLTLLFFSTLSRTKPFYNTYKTYLNLVLSNELIKVELPPWKIWKDDVSSVSPSSERIEELWVVVVYMTV